jgi:hypothetical protein
LIKTLKLVTVSTKPQEILKQMLQELNDEDFLIPLNNPNYYPYQGALMLPIPQLITVVITVCAVVAKTIECKKEN